MKPRWFWNIETLRASGREGSPNKLSSEIAEVGIKRHLISIIQDVVTPFVLLILLGSDPSPSQIKVMLVRDPVNDRRHSVSK